MAKKASLKPAFVGRWHIVSMSEWDEEYLNEEVQAFIEFGKNGTGNFQFGYVSGLFDRQPATRDGATAVEWSWEGGDGADCTPLTGRGWAILGDDKMNGTIYIHFGDESDFVAKRVTVKKATKRK